jgi:hypothetical protein
VVLQYLLVMTRIFGMASLGVLVFGIILGQQRKELSQAWLTVSTTLFVVALVLLVLIMRDQRRALTALKLADKQEVLAPQTATAAEPAGSEAGPDEEETITAASHIANVERGRIVSMGGVVSLIWLVILVLMVWNS